MGGVDQICPTPSVKKSNWVHKNTNPKDGTYAPLSPVTLDGDGRWDGRSLGPPFILNQYDHSVCTLLLLLLL